MPPAPEALASLASRDHGAFDAHYLRAFAHAMPWYARPQMSESPYAREDFLRHVFGRMQETVRPQESLKQRITFDRAVVRHVCFTILREGVYPHAMRYSAVNGTLPPERCREMMLKSVRHDLSRVVTRKVMVMPFPQHPLYGSYKARAAESVGGIPMKVMDTNTEDRAFADWLRGKPVADLLDAMPEITTPAEGVRVAQFCVDMRRKLAELTGGVSMLDEARLERCYGEITDAWVAMADPRLNEQMRPELEALQISDVFDVDIPDVLRVLDPSRMTADEERRRSPLLQQLALRLALAKDPRLADFANAWAAALLKFDVAACDRPHASAAQLAGLLSQPDTTVNMFRDRL